MDAAQRFIPKSKTTEGNTPHLTGTLRSEVEALRAEVKALQAQNKNTPQKITSRTRTMAGVLFLLVVVTSALFFGGKASSIQHSPDHALAKEWCALASAGMLNRNALGPKTCVRSIFKKGITADQRAEMQKGVTLFKNLKALGE